MKQNMLKLAIQKSGRLTNETLKLLRQSGLEFESYQQRLFSVCRNFPLEILYVRDDDIGDYVNSGTVDLGIIGQNILNEERPRVKKLLNLRYGFCSLVLAVPKDSKIKKVADLENKTIATTYLKSTKKFLVNNKIKAKLVKITGSVEITPTLGVAEAIVDLTSTGSTLALNDLKILEKVYDSEAVLIANKKIQAKKQELVNNLVMRFKGVLSAQNYKYVTMEISEKEITDNKKAISGLKTATITNLNKSGWVSVKGVIKESFLWETITKFKQLGAVNITVLPIEKIIN